MCESLSEENGVKCRQVILETCEVCKIKAKETR